MPELNDRTRRKKARYDQQKLRAFMKATDHVNGEMGLDEFDAAVVDNKCSQWQPCSCRNILGSALAE